MASERIRKNATVEIGIIKMTEKILKKSILIFMSTFWIMSEIKMRKFKEEFENLKNENARLTELVKVLEEQIKSLNLRLKLERELAVKQEFNPSSQMQISKEKMDEFIRQNIIRQMNAFEKSSF